MAQRKKRLWKKKKPCAHREPDVDSDAGGELELAAQLKDDVVVSE